MCPIPHQDQYREASLVHHDLSWGCRPPCVKTKYRVANKDVGTIEQNNVNGLSDQSRVMEIDFAGMSSVLYEEYLGRR